MNSETVKEIRYQLTNPLFREKTTVEIHMDGKVWINVKSHNNLISYAGMLYEVELKVLRASLENPNARQLPSAAKESFLGGDFASLGIKTTERMLWAAFGHDEQKNHPLIKRIMEVITPAVERITSGVAVLPYTHEVLR